MTYFTQLRAGLISSVLLMTTALASPALAETLPEISPRQIASDVEVKFNPQTGAREYVAPSFDPFEEDRSMAGTASLRSVSSAVTIDGQSVRGGALLDMTFYYNSASNDPYDTRGYDDAVYLSGEYAPVTLRDSRILECSEQVQDVVYYHEEYYRPSIYVNLFRPYRHYSGHHRYDRFWDRGYGYGRGYNGHRGYGSSRRDRIRNGDRRSRVRRGLTDRVIDQAREENGLPTRPRGTRSDRNRRSDREDRATRDRQTRDRQTRDRETRDRGGRADRTADRVRTENNRARNERAATGRRLDRTPAARDEGRRTNRATRTETRSGGRNGFMGGPRRLENNDAPRESRATRRANRNASTRSAQPRRERTPRATPAPRAAAPAPRPQRAERTAPAPRPQRAERATPAPRPQRTERTTRSRPDRNTSRAAQKTKSRNSPRGSSRGARGTKLKLMSFLPMASSWSRNAVRNVDVQCAREEMLTVHIPQERLDAARFDGLTVLVLDRAGQEIPVYVPANYVEGFRQAVNGRAAPNVSYQAPDRTAPVTRGPVYQQPRPYGIESAPCPAGTTKQNDGTCLQGGSPVYGGYPTR